MLPILGDFLTEFFKLCSKKESAEEILGRGPVEEEGKGNRTPSLLVCSMATGMCLNSLTSLPLISQYVVCPKGICAELSADGGKEE